MKRDDEIAAELGMCDLATDGPWEALLIRGGESERSLGVAPKGKRLEPIVETDNGVYGPDREDAVFIARSRTGYPRALRNEQEARAFLIKLYEYLDGSDVDIHEAGLMVRAFLERA